jgi:hypothetical protein
MKTIVEIDIKDFPLIMDYGIHWRGIKITYSDGIIGTLLMITLDKANEWLKSTGKNKVKVDDKDVELTPMEFFKSDLFINKKEIQKELIHYIYN